MSLAQQLINANNFNPLPRKRENMMLRRYWHTQRHFNPLPRKRENMADCITEILGGISIHSLVRGENPTVISDVLPDLIFQSTPS